MNNISKLPVIRRSAAVDLVAEMPGIVWEIIGNPANEHIPIHYISRYAVYLLGYPIKEWMETPGFWLQIIHPADKESVKVRLQSIFTRQQEKSIRYRWVTKDGKAIWVESRIAVMTNGNGESRGIRAMTLDVSSQVQIDKRKDEFISVASHELKTPLTSIKAYAELVNRRNEIVGDDLIGSYLERMNSQVERLTNLVYNLLDTTRIQVGTFMFTKKVFSVDKLILEVLRGLPQVKAKHPIEVRELMHVKVKADRARIAQVLTNFLTNAAKFSDEGKPIVVGMKIFPDKGKVVVGVRDFGKGISEENQKKLFRRFFQAARRKTNPQVSLGLGLYIAASIIRQHGGKIGVRSKLKEGSTFYFSLPMVKA